MTACEITEEESLLNPIHLKLQAPDLDFTHAQRAAMSLARSYYTDPLLLSWYDKRKGIHSPHEVECRSEGKPSWVAYAKSRGGNLTIDINNEAFVFIFQGKPDLS
jgi:hypothetical protein